MAYRFRLYAPTGVGITSLLVTKSNGATLCEVAPKGTSTACVDQSGMVVGLTITPYLEDGVSVSQWVVNVDGTVYYQYTDYCTIGYDDTVSNVQVRLEVDGTPTTTRYVTLEFDANGGSGAPSDVTFTGESEYVRGAIPSKQPTRSGYVFQGWSFDEDATSADYYAGVTYSWWASTDSNYSSTLYAVWSKSAGAAHIGNGYGFDRAAAYIWDGKWKKATPYIWDGKWKKGV